MVNTSNEIPPRLSFVFPCLNEEETIETCVTQVKQSLDKGDATYEIVVADNGSTDRSREIATRLGCRVVPVPERGYGAALRGGIEAARGEHVMFADCDNTYLYSDAIRLYQRALDTKADMSIASRIDGHIESGAMPFLHRWLGTPVLTSLINILFHGKLTDCNSGFRCIRKDAFATWQIRSNGMEFASELLIKALKAGAMAVEIQSGLRKGPEGRVAHLRTWRDGMRHLLFIFSEKPKLFEICGLVMLAVSTLLQCAAFVTGPVLAFGMFNIFDVHSRLLFLLCGILGAQLYVFSCMLYPQGNDRPLPLTSFLINLNEGTLFFLLLTALAGTGGLTLYTLVTWSLLGFENLHLAGKLLLGSHFLAVCLTFSTGLLCLHTLKKAQPPPEITNHHQRLS